MGLGGALGGRRVQNFCLGLKYFKNRSLIRQFYALQFHNLAPSLLESEILLFYRDINQIMEL